MPLRPTHKAGRKDTTQMFEIAGEMDTQGYEWIQTHWMSYAEVENVTYVLNLLSFF